MTSAEFRSWRKRLGLTQEEAAKALGRSVRQVQAYEAGQEIPRVVELATRTLKEWP